MDTGCVNPTYLKLQISYKVEIMLLLKWQLLKQLSWSYGWCVTYRSGSNFYVSENYDKVFCCHQANSFDKEIHSENVHGILHPAVSMK